MSAPPMVVPQDSNPVKRDATVAHRFQYCSRCVVHLNCSKLLAFQSGEKGDRDDVVRGREWLCVGDLGNRSLAGPVVMRMGLWRL